MMFLTLTGTKRFQRKPKCDITGCSQNMCTDKEDNHNIIHYISLHFDMGCIPSVICLMYDLVTLKMLNETPFIPEKTSMDLLEVR